MERAKYNNRHTTLVWSIIAIIGACWICWGCDHQLELDNNMATKPTDTVPDWPSNAVFSTGPSVGLPTSIDPTPYAGDGHIEGASNPTDCRVQNGWQKRVGNWCRWAEAGSSLGAADAHPLETNATGSVAVRQLDVLGNPAVGGDSLSVTRGLAGSIAASITTAGVSTILMGGDNIAMQITSSGGGLAIGSTGDTIPLTLYPQTTRPTTFFGNDGGVYIEKVVQGGNDAFALRIIGNNERYSVPIYRNQHVHAWESGFSFAFNGNSTAQTTILDSNLLFYQGLGPLDANIPLYFDISFEASISSAPADFAVVFKNNGTPIRTFNVHLPSTTINQVFLRGSYISGAAALNGNTFTVTAYKYASGGPLVTVENVIATIKSIR